jgi:transcription initiation factor TFIIIB Brf1 subunit/transcription initiation factor TFIIB
LISDVGAEWVRRYFPSNSQIHKNVIRVANAVILTVEGTTPSLKAKWTGQSRAAVAATALYVASALCRPQPIDMRTLSAAFAVSRQNITTTGREILNDIDVTAIMRDMFPRPQRIRE